MVLSGTEFMAGCLGRSRSKLCFCGVRAGKTTWPKTARHITRPSPRRRVQLPCLSGMSFGRSSDLQAAYLLRLPRSISVHGWTEISPVPWSERSFLLTAAGQFRICAGFPFQVRLAIHHRKQNRLYREPGTGSTSICCGLCGNAVHAPVKVFVPAITVLEQVIDKSKNAKDRSTETSFSKKA